MIIIGEDKEKVKKTIGQNMNFVRKANMYRQADIAEVLGISTRAYIAAEKGYSCFRDKNIVKFAEYFEIPVEWLIEEMPLSRKKEILQTRWNKVRGL